MNIPGELIPIVMFICAAATVIFFPLVRAYARKIEKQPEQPRLSGELATRLERMEQAIDSIAIEVERISEGQRFTTKLLADRAKADEALPN